MENITPERIRNCVCLFVAILPYWLIAVYICIYTNSQTLF